MIGEGASTVDVAVETGTSVAGSAVAVKTGTSVDGSAVAVATGTCVAGSVVGNSVEKTALIASGADILDAAIFAFAVYSICRRGAPAASPSYAFAARLPLPVIMIAIEFPETQFGLLIISWMIGAKFGVD